MRKLKLLIALCMVTIAASASKTVYFQPNSNWAGNTTRYSLYLFTGENAGPWLDFTATGDGTYNTTISDEQESWESMIIVAMNPATTENNWDTNNKWNQSNNLAAAPASGLLYTQPANVWDNFDCAISIYGATAASFTDGGKYIFKNVGSGRYLGPGNNWGTQASLLAQSHFNFIHGSNGTFTFESQVSNGGNSHFFTGTYMDGGAANVTITQVAEGVYNMSNGSTYYGYDGNSTVLASNLTNPAADNAKWQIVSYEEALKDATEENPVDATFMILDQNFDRNNRYGGGSNNDLGNQWTIESSNYNLCGPNNNNESPNKLAESWRAAFTLSQTITVPNGYYKVRAQAATTIYDNSGTDDLPVVYANDVTTPFNICTNGNDGMDDFSTDFTNGNFFTAWSNMLTVTGKSITVGVKGTRTNTWCVWDNIQLMYYGPIDLSGYAASLAEAVAAAEATNGTIPTACYDAIAAVVAEKNQTYDNEDDYIAAIAAINTAIDTYAYEDIKLAYARYQSIRAAVLAIDNAIDVTTFDAAANGATTNTAIDEVVPNLRNALTAAIANIESQNIDLTAALIDNPEPGVTGKTDYWTNTSTPGLQYNLYEFYNVEATTKQEIKATLPIGYYKLTVVGFTRDEDGFDAVSFADGNQHPLARVARDVVNDRNQGNNWIAQGNGNGVSENVFQLTAEEPDLEIGIWTGAKGSEDNWTCWRSFKLEFLGTAPLFLFQNELAEEVAAANAHATELGETIPAGVMTAYTEAISTAAAANSTIEACLQSIQDIKDATDAADACVAPYAAYNTLKVDVQALYDVAAYEELIAGSHDALGTALSTAATNVAAATTAAAIEEVSSTLNAASVTYVGAANPTGDAKFVLTYLLTNPNVDAFYNGQYNVHVDGWYTEQSDGNFQVVPGEGCANADGIHKHAYEYWSEAPKSNNKFTLYQKVNLPEGTYTINCYAFADQSIGGDNRGIYFYANDTQGSLVANNVLTQQEVSFVNEDQQEVKIGLKAVTGNTYRWMGIGYMELYKVPAKSYIVDETLAWDNTTEGAGAVTLNRTIKEGVNTLVLPFSMTQAEVETNFGTGSVVYVVDAYEADKDNLKFTTHDGISANMPCLLDATVAGTSYTLANRTIVAGTPEAVITGAKMVGTYAATMNAPQGSYIINGGKIYNVNSTVALKNTRAYIELTTPGARALSISFDGNEATGIATLENGELKVETGIIYDLSGRRVSTPTKGIYVINGKKVVK